MGGEGYSQEVKYYTRTHRESEGMKRKLAGLSLATLAASIQAPSPVFPQGGLKKGSSPTRLGERIKGCLRAIAKQPLLHTACGLSPRYPTHLYRLLQRQHPRRPSATSPVVPSGDKPVYEELVHAI
jgi:hypothetical protein